MLTEMPKVGDVVRLNSRGPYMTVMPSLLTNNIDGIKCVWFNTLDEVQTEYFLKEILIKD